MKKYILTFILLQVFAVSGQISTTAPQITRGTPSVASLMNFVEVPVNKFTGVPDINIPLFTFPTRSKDINLDVSVNYHPAGINVLDRASDVGMGWNLMADAVISRTIVGPPDEFYESNPNAANYFVNTFNNVYSYSFLGHSGNFSIVRDVVNNTFSIKMEDNSTLKIDFVMNSNASIDSFTIYDDKGYKYFFDNYDYNVSNFRVPTDIVNSMGEAVSRYRSAHHLTRVVDNNGKELLNYNYTTLTRPHHLYTDLSNVTKKIDNIVVEGIGKAEFDFDYNTELEDSDNDPYSLNSVIIKDASGAMVKKYGFTYGFYNLKENRRILTKVSEFNTNLTSSKDYQLFYKTSVNGPAINFEDYVIDSDMNGYPNLTPKCGTGIYNILSTETSPEFCDMGVLQKMVLPTGGSILYEFESNTFSTEELPYNPPGTQESEYYKLRHNYTPASYLETDYDMANSLSNGFTVTGTTPKKLYFKFESIPYVDPFLITPDPENPYPVHYILKKNGVQIYDFAVIEIHNIGIYDVHDCLGVMVELDPGTYTINMSLPGGLVTSGHISISEKLRNTTLKEWTYGGGIRIKKIAHFDINVNQTYLYNPSTYNPIMPAKEVNYDYHYFNNIHKSSGQYFGGNVTEDGLKDRNPQIGYLNV